MSKLAPKTSAEARAYCKAQDSSNTTKWYRMCLKLQRTARGLPAVYPTAASAQVATPQSERVGLTGLKPGMIAYTKGSNPAGHIVLVEGWKAGLKNASNLMVWSNDVGSDGKGVAAVPLQQILGGWRHSFQFGATWLNGYDFSEFNKPAVSVHGTLGKNVEHAIEDLRKAVAFHKKGGNKDLVAILERDLKMIEATYAKHNRKRK